MNVMRLVIEHHHSPSGSLLARALSARPKLRSFGRLLAEYCLDGIRRLPRLVAGFIQLVDIGEEEDFPKRLAQYSDHAGSSSDLKAPTPGGLRVKS